MDHATEVTTVGKMLDLEKRIDELRRKAHKLGAKRYVDLPVDSNLQDSAQDNAGSDGRLPRPHKPEEPAEPCRQQVDRVFPAPKDKSKIPSAILTGFVAWLVASLVASCVSALTGSYLLFFVLWIGIIVGAIKGRKKLLAKDLKRIEQSDEFKAEIAELEAKYDAQQRVFDERYEREFSEYQEKLKQYDRDMEQYKEDMAAFNEAKRAWEQQRDEQVSRVSEKIASLSSELEDLYNSSGLIPLKYRDIDALEAVYQTISTSSYDVKFALESYERDMQRELEEQRLHEQMVANRHAEIANEHAAQQNSLLEEQNRIAEKTRRDADVAAAVATLQRRKQRKQAHEDARKAAGN